MVITEPKKLDMKKFSKVCDKLNMMYGKKKSIPVKKKKEYKFKIKESENINSGFYGSSNNSSFKADQESLKISKKAITTQNQLKQNKLNQETKKKLVSNEIIPSNNLLSNSTSNEIDKLVKYVFEDFISSHKKLKKKIYQIKKKIS